MANKNKKVNFFAKHSNFNLNVRLETGEVFPLKNITPDMKISELKSYIEFAAGIPYHMQRLNYLDEGDLQDDTDIRYNDIVPGGTLALKVWHMWKNLVEAAASNDVEAVMKMGVSNKIDFKTPNSEYMGSKNKAVWIAERAFVALYIASHRGHLKMVQKLIQAGANVNAQTPKGRSALHVAAAQGHGKIVDLLLEKGSNINAADQFGDSALQIATKFGHKGCERHLFLFRWQERAKKTKPSFQDIPLMAHQFFDSKFPVWLHGNHGQVYFQKILPPGEFEGTAFHAPRNKERPSSAPKEREKGSRESNKSKEEDIQVDLGTETLKNVMEIEAEANRHKDYLKSLANKKVKIGGRGSPKMPAIEERSMSGSAATSRNPKSVKSGASDREHTELYGSPVDEKGNPRPSRGSGTGTRSSHGSPSKSVSGVPKTPMSGKSSGRSRSYGFSKGSDIDDKSKASPKTFDDWLKVKKDQEARQIEDQKLLEEEKRKEKELEAREKLLREASYDQWLQEKEKYVKKEAVKKRHNPDRLQEKEKQVAEIKEKYKPKERQRTPYDEWLMKKEMELLEKIKMGQPVIS
ncbi:uncharacterized protein LOC106180414 [Lingula anatina]|uniref:Uncharacterized protein LOC106180414 n=1 Tax=Lingula anatina TaxID=7574 RepID=A0A1S3KBN0_LINAN|nr:uncharacterized protein LOC106180414 [Lingula anatina]|eukprot:XP_013419849.1 uncharacterized protein LOC106180414 [Lingula anatina]